MNKRSDFAFPCDLADEIGIGAEVGECVADEYERANDRELTERRDLESACNNGDEKNRESLCGDAGEEEMEGVASQ